MPESHREVHALPDLLLEVGRELARDAKKRRAPDDLVAALYLVQKLGRRGTAAADVGEKGR